MDGLLELPRSLFGAGALDRLPEELAALGVRRPLVVSDAGLRASGVLQRVLDRLPAATAVFDRVTPNPVFADADAGCAAYRDAGCDGVVAVGGGSVIDVAKLIALIATHGGTVRDYVGRPDPFQRPAAPLIAIPTTAGTGSECSPDAGIHPDAHSASAGIRSRWAVPRLALLDPTLTASLPPRLTAATGIDALSHCIEGFLSKMESPLGDTLALDGIARVRAHLERATVHGDDLAARGGMLVAGYLGGAAIGMGLGPAHAIAISCGDQGLHHGLLSGIGVVATLDAVLARVPAKHAALARALGVPAGRSASAAVAAMMQSVGLPATLKQAGYRAADSAALDRLAAAAYASPFNLSSRWHPDAAAYQQVIGASLEGRLPPAAAD